MRRKLDGARVLLTGASSGIGRALARELAEQRADLLITARRGDRLETLATDLRSQGLRVSVVVGDIVLSTTRDELVRTAVSEFDGLDILINNSGVGTYGAFSTSDENRLRRLMEVNFFAPAELIRATLPLLKDGRDPLIVNVGSVLGHFAVPNKSEYCASKFAMHGFSDSLRCELVSKNIGLLLVSPSTTKSEFFDSLIDPQVAPTVSPFQMTPEAVASRIVSAMRSRRREIVLSVGGKMLVAVDRLVPWLTNWIFARFGGRKF
ncbi:MAG: SDR family NAD(P)-dependent oxidoreductase [Pirellulaceae bacterium]|nr:SDR family NAD(P)-dependent oxidoreductase [Pirellulaceae bacterium]